MLPASSAFSTTCTRIQRRAEGSRYLGIWTASLKPRTNGLCKRGENTRKSLDFAIPCGPQSVELFCTIFRGDSQGKITYARGRTLEMGPRPRLDELYENLGVYLVFVFWGLLFRLGFKQKPKEEQKKRKQAKKKKNCLGGPKKETNPNILLKDSGPLVHRHQVPRSALSSPIQVRSTDRHCVAKSPAAS